MLFPLKLDYIIELMNEAIRQSYCSFTGDNIKPIHLPLPLTLEKIADFHRESMLNYDKTKETLNMILKYQSSFPLLVLVRILFLVVLGSVILYLCVLALILSLFNPILFLILVGVAAKYINWTIGNVKGHIQKNRMGKIRKQLEKENKEYYCKKLVRWVYNDDLNEIVMHNLRLHQGPQV